jgi:hypothetical protein
MRNFMIVITAFMLAAVSLTGCGGDKTTGADSPVTVAPLVSSTIPVHGEIDVFVNRSLSATFSKEMDPLTITDETFILEKNGTDPVVGAVAYSGFVATFNPTDDLDPDAEYTATITTGAKDLDGIALAADKIWSFTTGADSDITLPEVTTTIPVHLGTDVAINANISATFSEGMDSDTITDVTFTLEQGTTPVVGVVTYSGFVATFNPTDDLDAGAEYTATITIGAKDLAGNALAAEKIWSFTTGEASDTTPPTVISTIPVDLAEGVAINANISATFSEGMDSDTISNATFTLKQGETIVDGAVTYSGFVAEFNPTGDLDPDAVYTATITTGAKDLAGNALAANEIWSFTTVTSVGAGPLPVDLGLAGNYVILAESAIASSADVAKYITGDMGISPAAASFITGFSLVLDSTQDFSTSDYVTGKIYAADYTGNGAGGTPGLTSGNLTIAVTNMHGAYTDAEGRPDPDGLDLGSAGEIGGLTTLVPGLYKWTTAVTIATDLTLTGNANDVWIFQIAGGLTMAADAKIILAGDAQAKNIFWQTGTTVTLNSNTHFQGIALSKTTISLVGGDGIASVVTGRLLSQTNVILGDYTTVVQP